MVYVYVVFRDHGYDGMSVAAIFTELTDAQRYRSAAKFDSIVIEKWEVNNRDENGEVVE